MGKIKLETVNNGRNNHEWDSVNLNSLNNLYLLIKNRSRFEETYLSKQFNVSPVSTNGVPRFVENIICIYVDIDLYIKKTSLTKLQKVILKYIMLGYNYTDIAELINNNFELNYDNKLIKCFFISICKRIFFRIQNDYEVWLEVSENKKIKNTSMFKKCCSCKEFYNLKDLKIMSRFNDRLYYYCRDCKSFADAKRHYKIKYKITEV